MSFGSASTGRQNSTLKLVIVASCCKSKAKHVYYTRKIWKTSKISNKFKCKNLINNYSFPPVIPCMAADLLDPRRNLHFRRYSIRRDRLRRTTTMEQSTWEDKRRGDRGRGSTTHQRRHQCQSGQLKKYNWI